MLSVSAYSFRQKSRLAISLSWVGGYANVIAFMACGAFVSHVTGTTTLIGKNFVSGDWRSAFFAGFIWLMFLVGAAASAMMTETAKRRGMASKYILPMAIEAMLLCLFALSLHTNRSHSLSDLYRSAGLAALAMGLQNATITKISGAVVRTTHLTGVTTDLGLEGVQFLIWLHDRSRGRRWERAGRVLRVSQRHPGFLRVLLLASIFFSFLCGATVGTILYLHLHEWALMLPVAFLGWIIYVDWHTPIADVREIDLLADAELRGLGILKPLLPVGLGIWRVSCRTHRQWHRAPDFQLWAERIPQRWRVVILGLSPLIRFDANSMLVLQSAIERLHGEGRRLILSGVTPRQFRLLIDGEIDKTLGTENICSDLEFAVARGIDLLQQASPLAAKALPIPA